MDYLLSNEKQVLNWLYGLDLELGDEGPFEGYREVKSMGGSVISSIDQIKAIAESIFTKDYLEHHLDTCKFAAKRAKEQGDMELFSYYNGRAGVFNALLEQWKYKQKEEEK